MEKRRLSVVEWVELLRQRARHLKQTYHASIMEKRSEHFLEAAAENDELADYLEGMIAQGKMLQDELAANMIYTRRLEEELGEANYELNKLEKR